MQKNSMKKLMKKVIISIELIEEDFSPDNDLANEEIVVETYV